VKAPGATVDLTTRFNALREVLHNEIAASEALMTARISQAGAERSILLTGLDQRTQAIHDELDGQLGHLQRQVDQRFDASRETLTALKVMLDERYATQTKALDAAFKAAEQAVAVALANAEKATVKAEMAADKRFDAVNEFRQVLTDQTATFLPRTEYEASHSALSERVTASVERMGNLELRLTGRLDRGDGITAGTTATVTDRRAEAGFAQTVQTDRAAQLRATIGIAVASFSAVVAVIVGIVVIVKGG
jgi:hypothetical protein